MHKYECKWDRDHVVITRDGKFYGTADTMFEAAQDIEEDRTDRHCMICGDELYSDDGLFLCKNCFEGHKIICKGKCTLCGKPMVKEEDGIFFCHECQLKLKRGENKLGILS